MTPLTKRVITAAFLLPAAIALVLLTPLAWFAAVVVAVFCLAMWEWTMLAGFTDRTQRVLVVLAFVGVCFGLWLLRGTAWWWLSIAAGVVWWGLSLLWLRKLSFAAAPMARNTAIKLLTGALVMVPAWVAAVELHGNPDHGPFWVLFVLVLIWAADSFAYFAGSRWGTTKLAPRVSPGKSWAGVWGALIGSGLVAVGGAYLLDERGLGWLLLVVLAIVTIAISIVGDLFESLMKRQANVKDSGSLFPGHGGLLDRLDSVFAAFPIFVAGKALIDLLLAA